MNIFGTFIFILLFLEISGARFSGLFSALSPDGSSSDVSSQDDNVKTSSDVLGITGQKYIVFASIGIRSHIYPLITMAKQFLNEEYRIVIVSHDVAFKYIAKEIPSVLSSEFAESVQFVSVGSIKQQLSMKKRESGSWSDNFAKVVKGDSTMLHGTLHLFDHIYGPSAERFRYTLTSLCDEKVPDLL